MNPYLYVTQVTVTPTPIPTPLLVNQWFIGGVGPFNDGQIILFGIVCAFLFVFALIVFSPMDDFND